ncbi:hypothetical protein [Acinetobacter parvus]|uniref:hypothetical protein n=1 Tax=Acinetobacter parvus TaxID=134533 RepID=UPI00391BA786
MTKFIEKLQDPKFKDKTESLIGGHIMAVYRDAGLEPPVPFIGNNDQFTYVDQRPDRYARHLREGMKLLAEALDAENGGENA